MTNSKNYKMKLETTNLEIVLVDNSFSEETLNKYAREIAEQTDEEVIQNTLLVEAMYKHNSQNYTSKDALSYLQSLKEKEHSGVFLILKDNSVAGIFGLKPEEYNKKAEIWYWLGKDFRGKNYMGETLEKMISYSFSQLGLNKLIAEVFSYNKPSENLLLTNNFEYVGCKKKDAYRKGEYVDTYIYELLNN